MHCADYADWNCVQVSFQSLLKLNSVLENCQMSTLAPARKMSTFDQCGKQFAEEEEQERCKLHQHILTKHFFSGNQSCQQLKSTKPQHFHEFFSQKNRQFFS